MERLPRWFHAVDRGRVGELLDADPVLCWRAATAREVDDQLDDRDDLTQRMSVLGCWWPPRFGAGCCCCCHRCCQSRSG